MTGRCLPWFGMAILLLATPSVHAADTPVPEMLHDAFYDNTDGTPLEGPRDEVTNATEPTVRDAVEPLGDLSEYVLWIYNDTRSRIPDPLYDALYWTVPEDQDGDPEAAKDEKTVQVGMLYDRAAPPGAEGITADQDDPLDRTPEPLPATPSEPALVPATRAQSSLPASETELATITAGVGLAIATALALCALFSRLRSDKMADHPVRARILALIETEPGLRLHEIADRLSLRSSHVIYHTRMMADHEVVKIECRGRAKHVFPPTVPPAKRDQAAALRNPKARSIRDHVAKHPGARLKDVQEKLGMSPSLASWYLKGLREAGVLAAQGDGHPRYVVAKEPPITVE